MLKQSNALPMPAAWALAVPDGSTVICSLVVDGEPIPKARGRYDARTRRVYTAKRTQEGQEAFRGWLVAAGVVLNETHRLGVRVSFHMTPGRRCDLDNLVKLVFDACNRIAWHDDSQVAELTARLVRGDGEPRTELVIYTVGESRERFCERCGKRLRPRVSAILDSQRYCSRACRYAEGRLGTMVPCAVCGTEVYRSPSRTYGSALCSAACREKSDAQRRPYCVDCGVALVNSAAARCRSCEAKRRRDLAKNGTPIGGRKPHPGTR